jgi:hypothetical protein
MVCRVRRYFVELSMPSLACSSGLPSAVAEDDRGSEGSGRSRRAASQELDRMMPFMRAGWVLAVPVPGPSLLMSVASMESMTSTSACTTQQELNSLSVTSLLSHCELLLLTAHY